MTEPQASFDLPPQLSTLAPQVDWLYNFIYWVSVVSFIGIVGTMVFYAYKYRRRPGRVAKPSGHSTLLEVAWTFAPLLLLGFLFHAGFKTYMFGAVAPRDAIEVRVTGKQWSWDFMQPNGGVETNEVHLPVGQPVEFVMSSVDVLHSLFIPDFRTKRDVVPGMYTSLWFEALPEAEGEEITIYCAEYCGAPVGGTEGDQPHTNHSTMRATLHMMSSQAYEAFLPSLMADVPEECAGEEDPDACWGQQLYMRKACVGCHQTDGSTPAPGPNWGGLYNSERALADGSTVTADDNYIREAILNPGGQIAAGFETVPMPPFALRDREIEALIAYIRSLNE